MNKWKMVFYIVAHLLKVQKSKILHPLAWNSPTGTCQFLTNTSRGALINNDSIWAVHQQRPDFRTIQHVRQNWRNRDVRFDKNCYQTALCMVEYTHYSEAVSEVKYISKSDVFDTGGALIAVLVGFPGNRKTWGKT